MFSIIIPSGVVDFHYALVKDLIVTRIEEVKSYSGLDSKFEDLLEWLCVNSHENMEKLIKAEPKELMCIYSEWRTKFQFKENGRIVFGYKGITSKQYRGYFKRIFDYEIFTNPKDNKAYLLTEKLGVRVCPYCNRQFVFTVIDRTSSKKQNIIRPELDHYFPKSKYPMFALSFYNLIPCCHICNCNVKGRKNLDIKKHYHPYIDENKDFKFKYTKSTIGKTKIKYDHKNLKKAKDTLDFFMLKKIYQSHNDETDKIDNLYQEYDKGVVEEIHTKLTKAGIGVSKARLLDIIYGHYVVKNPDNEILGKLRSDIYEQVKKRY